MPEPMPPAPAAPPPLPPEIPNAPPTQDGGTKTGLKAQTSKRKQMQQSAMGTKPLRNDLAIGSSASTAGAPSAGLNIQK